VTGNLLTRTWGAGVFFWRKFVVVRSVLVALVLCLAWHPIHDQLLAAFPEDFALVKRISGTVLVSLVGVLAIAPIFRRYQG
jgi:hypothetical protein